MMQPLDAQTMLTNGQLAPLSSRPSPRQHASQRSYLTGAPASYSPLHGPDTGLTLLTTRCGFNTLNLLQRYGPTLLVEIGFDATYRVTKSFRCRWRLLPRIDWGPGPGYLMQGQVRSPVAPPFSLPPARLFHGTGFHSTGRRHPRSPAQSAAWRR